MRYRTGTLFVLVMLVVAVTSGIAVSQQPPPSLPEPVPPHALGQAPAMVVIGTLLLLVVIVTIAVARRQRPATQ